MIFARDVQYLLLGAVAQFTLPQAADKFRRGGRRTGGFGILAGYLHHAITRSDPIVHLLGDA